MKKLIILITILILGIQLQAQISFPQPHTGRVKSKVKYALPKAYYHSKWSLGLSLKSSIENIIPNLVYSDKFHFHLKPKFSYDVNLFIERRMENNWTWESGINFHGVSFEYDHQTPVYFDKNTTPNSDGKIRNEYHIELDNMMEKINISASARYTMFEDGNDYANGDELNFRTRSMYSIQYLGIPLSVKKGFGNRRLRFTTGFGIEPTILLKSKVDYEYYHQSGFAIEGNQPDFKHRLEEYPRVELENVSINSISKNLKDFQVNGFINLGFVHTYKWHSFFMEAEIKRGLTAFSKKSDFTSYLNSVGVKVGVIKRFEESKVIDMVNPRKLFRW